MITSKDLLNRLKLEKQLVSNRQVAVFLGISHTTVNRIAKDEVWSDDLACEIAEILGLDVDLVLLGIIAERSTNPKIVQKLQAILEEREGKRLA